jgi:uncharacterized protein (TIGR00369 family)
VSGFTPRSARWEARCRESFAKQQAMATVGARIERVAPGEVDIAFDHAAALTQQHGFVHAGILTTVLDSACGYAAFTLMDDDSGVLSVEFKVNLLAPARGPRFVARARVVRPGRTVTVCTADLFAGDGGEETIVATMLGTMMAVRGREDVVG